jgi:hypothetical protein
MSKRKPGCDRGAPHIQYDSLIDCIKHLLDCAGDLGAGFDSDSYSHHSYDSHGVKIWLKKKKDVKA